MSEILQELASIHYECCKRPNVSSHVLLNTFIASGDSQKAIAAAIMTFGNTHAPVDKALLTLSATDSEIKEFTKLNIRSGRKIAGFGSSFVKEKSDYLFRRIEEMVSERDPRAYKISRVMTDILHEHGKMIYPNAAFWTAAAGKILGYNKDTIPFLLIQCRMNGWKDTLQKYIETGEIFYEDARKKKAV